MTITLLSRQTEPEIKAVMVRSTLVLLMLAILGGCGRAEQIPHQSKLFTLGTLVDISIWGVDDDVARMADTAVEDELNEIHRNWHAWQPSALTQLNGQLAQGETVDVDPALAELISKGRELAQQSGQLFNPAIGKLIALWGFHADERPDLPPPSATAIQQLLDLAPTMDQLTISGNSIKSANPAIQLDFGAFAKGYAVDSAIARLREFGIKDAIVNAGGDLRAIGSHGQRPWRIGIRHPKDSGIIASLETHGDESVFTSGNYERYFDYQGTRYHHIIDPRSGYPARGAISVTVIHSDATTADAAATALLVAGPTLWHDIARKMGITQVMLIDDDMNIYMTPAMAKRIRFQTNPAPKVSIQQR